MKLNIAHEYKEIKGTEYYERIKKYKSVIKKCIEYCIKEEEIKTDKTIEIYIRYTNNEEIKKINKEYRNIDKETDVLSFPMYESFEVKEELGNGQMPIYHLGDIIISIEKVEKQSIEYGHPFERELIYLITHAMFHLLGYDHMEEEEKKVMREKEESVMVELDILR